MLKYCSINVGENKRLKYVHEDGTSLVGNEEYFFCHEWT